MISKKDKLIDVLLEKLGEEIATYRRRQISTFREAVIVLAVITWGVSHIAPNSSGLELYIRILAGIACILISLLGVWIIYVYRERIYFIRNKRDELIEKLIEKHFDSMDIQLFYPTEMNAEKFSEKFKKVKTSTIYGWSLIVVGILSALVNVMGGQWIP